MSDQPNTPEESLAALVAALPSLEERMTSLPGLIEETVQPVRDAVSVLEEQDTWFKTIVRFLWRIMTALLVSFALDICITTWLFISSRNAEHAVTTANAAIVQLQEVAQSRNQACATYNFQIATTRQQIIATDTALLNLEQNKLSTLVTNQQASVTALGKAQYQQTLLADQAIVASLQKLVAGATTAFSPVNCAVPPLK